MRRRIAIFVYLYSATSPVSSSCARRFWSRVHSRIIVVIVHHHTVDRPPHSHPHPHRLRHPSRCSCRFRRHCRSHSPPAVMSRLCLRCRLRSPSPLRLRFRFRRSLCLLFAAATELPKRALSKYPRSVPIRVLVERNATICRFLNEEALGERAIEA